MAFSTGTLAQGCFGKIYREKYKDKWAAIKRVPQEMISRKDLERECEVYNKSNHPNIVKLLGDITLRDGKWTIPLEFIFGEDLETIIFKPHKANIKLTDETKATIITGMCEGLLHLHQKDIVHQDLKPDNIMVEQGTNRAVIIDLGLAKFYKLGLNSAMNMGNEAYSAPEVLQLRSQRSQRSDVWAMGKIIAELLARVRLYTPTVSPAKVRETIKDEPYCGAVCRMVEPNPLHRAAMYTVIADIRRAAGEVELNSPNGKELLGVPENRRNRSASPFERLRNREPPRQNLMGPGGRPRRARTPSPPKQNGFPNRFDFQRAARPEMKNRPGIGPGKAITPPKQAAQSNPEKDDASDITDLLNGMLRLKLSKLDERLANNLPTNGKVMLELMDKELGGMKQIEIVTRNGKIVKYEESTVPSK